MQVVIPLYRHDTFCSGPKKYSRYVIQMPPLLLKFFVCEIGHFMKKCPTTLKHLIVHAADTNIKVCACADVYYVQ